MTPTVDELVKGRAHFDASVHIGGHPGEPWPEHKCLVLTRDRQTWLCLLRDGAEVVEPVTSVREGLELFAAELAAAIAELPGQLPEVVRVDGGCLRGQRRQHQQDADQPGD